MTGAHIVCPIWFADLRRCNSLSLWHNGDRGRGFWGGLLPSTTGGECQSAVSTASTAMAHFVQ